jgi:hypothetical protein
VGRPLSTLLSLSARLSRSSSFELNSTLEGERQISQNVRQKNIIFDFELSIDVRFLKMPCRLSRLGFQDDSSSVLSGCHDGSPPDSVHGSRRSIQAGSFFFDQR